ncbi:endonuclease domain-containing protein [Azospirillum sp. NL1]|nr:DUF559 domain-containing protein [Azospirillum sp. NL1]MDW5536018.1 DUF559 domain-containing protein [Azospirillum sp. NL1]
MWRRGGDTTGKQTLSPPGRGEGEGDAQRSFTKTPRSASPSPRPSPRGGEGDRPLGRAGEMARVAQAKPTDYITGRARDLRMNATDVEKIVWQKLRNAQLGAKFRRQEPILGFVADFVAHDHRLIIELDGGQHAEQRAAHDERRARMLEQAGFRILRFWNTDVIDNLDGVLETIRARLEETSILRSQPSGREFP